MTSLKAMNNKRVRLLKKGHETTGPIVYWMSRDQRTHDNWALLYAQENALWSDKPLLVVFCLVPQFLGATIRHYGFMLSGLQEVEKELKHKNIPFYLLMGNPEEEIPKFIKSQHASLLVTDFDPLKIKQQWKNSILQNITIPFYEVDAHNVIPAWIVSQKQEYAAYTLRPKHKLLLPEFLDDFYEPVVHPFFGSETVKGVDWKEAYSTLQVDRSVSEVDWIKPGQGEALKQLSTFIQTKLSSYDTLRNDPTCHGQSHLSPYLHFGHLSAQRAALEVNAHEISEESKKAFLEELLVRRELSDNFCLYNSQYDSFDAFPQWAQKTLNDHRQDRRAYVYRLDQFELAETHDDLWNASQKEMVIKGKMHGYMRMYWAKKILEWTESLEQALEYAIYLNDKYELDGRDPNGYTGIAWSIGGVHDRAWKEREIFGKIRYMSYQGCVRKFNVKEYIKRY